LVIGVLSLQGDVAEHLKMLKKCGCNSIKVKNSAELERVQGLIIPGGESTTVCKLLSRWNILELLRFMGERGFPIFGTCTGMILLGKKIIDGAPNQETLRLMNVTVRRNAFGRQRESFEAPLSIPVIGEKPFPGVFIRAPYLDEAGEGVEILTEFEGKIVAAKERNFLVSAFHPELTDDTRFHEYFIDMVCNSEFDPCGGNEKYACNYQKA